MLVVVHTEQLSLGRRTQVEAGDHVDGLSDEGGDNKGVGAAGNSEGDLNVQLLPVVVDPASLELHVDTVETNDVIGTEEGVENETDDTTDSMLSEHIESVVNLDHELDLGAKVASDTGGDTEDNASPRGDDTGGRSSSDETRDSARAPTDERPLLGKSVVENAPGNGSEHGSKSAVPASHGSTQVGTESRTAVEAEPAEEEEDGTEGDERDVVRAEVEHHLLVAAAQDPRVGQSRHTGANLDRTTTRVVENTVLEGPAVGTPGPAGKRAVDESGPDKDKDHGRNDTTTLSNSTNHEGSRHAQELHLRPQLAAGYFTLQSFNVAYLVERVEKLRDERGAGRLIAEDALETELVEVADIAVRRGRAESKRITPEVPLENNNAVGHHDNPDERESRFSPGETGVEESNTRHHDHDHGGRDDDVSLVALIEPDVQVVLGCARDSFVSTFDLELLVGRGDG